MTTADNSSTYGQTVPFTAQVANQDDPSDTPTGKVQFYVDGAKFGLLTPLDGNGTASIDEDQLPPGTHQVTATYQPSDGEFSTSTSGIADLVVSSAATTTTISTDPNPSDYDQAVTFTAQVADTSPDDTAEPTGNVQFYVDGSPYGSSVPLGDDGTATIDDTDLPAGSHDVTADYIPDTDDFSASSGSATQVVGEGDTTSTTVTTSDNPSDYGQDVTFTASVADLNDESQIPTGVVQFSIDASPYGTAVPLDDNGEATIDDADLPAGSHDVSADYIPDTNDFSASSGLATQVVTFADTTTTVATERSPSAYGQAVTFGATVDNDSPDSTATPTGSVEFYVDGAPYGSAPLDADGGALISDDTLAAGTHQITAGFLPADDNFGASLSETPATQVVTFADTTTDLTSSVNPSVYGQSVVFTATVTANPPGSGTPTGSVTFYDGPTVIDTETLIGGMATFSTAALSVGAQPITAVYGGDGNFMTSTSNTVIQTVNQAGTTTSLMALPTSTISGQPVTLVATIAVAAPGAGTPTGSVQFFNGSVPLGTVNLIGNSAILTTTTLPVGTDSITAQYTGDSNFTDSTSNAVSVTITNGVVGIATTTSDSSSANPSVFGQSVTYTATVTPTAGSGTPTGTVTFYSGSKALGTAALTGKKASLKTIPVSVGSQAIVAVYSGNSTYSPSTSSALTQTVNQAGTTTAVASVVTPSVYGQPLTFTATVSANAPGGGTPTGTVTFSAGATILGTATLSSGTASLTVSPQLAVGNHTIKASYGGDTDFKASAGTLTQTVDQDGTTTSLASSTTPSVYGQAVTFTAVVSADAPGSGTPTGSVTFMDGSTALGTVALSGGTAAYSTAKLPTGPDSITATYNGSSSFITSTASLIQAVDQDATSASVTSSLNPSVYGQSVTFTAVVLAASPGGGTPTGTVTFLDGSTALDTAALDAGGKATFKTTVLVAGSHSITVVYSGDSNFIISTSSVLKQIVS